MHVRHDHQRRYYRHNGEYAIQLRTDHYAFLHIHITTPRHYFNFALKKGRKIVAPSPIFDDV
jgi:hypothetical protein